MVVVSRTASENVELLVEAASQDEAEELIGDALDSTTRVGIEDLTKLEGVKVATHDFCGDDESSWEVV
jgi:hypothetical protein